jgi:pyridoxine 4-dehydrogenase
MTDVPRADRREDWAEKEGAAMNAMPTAAAADKIDVGGDLRVNRLGLGAMRITGSGIWGDPPDRSGRSPWRP